MSTVATQTRAQDEDAAHALPRWFTWVQNNILLSILIGAEAYLLGSLMVIGWVPNIEDPHTWGWYGGIGVVLFFGAGALAAGIALKASLKAAACFKRGEWGFALFNFFGVCMFSVADIWASLSERSTNLHPTPADTSVLALMNVANFPVTPTVVIVALLLTITTLWYGFSQQKPAVKSEQDIEEEGKRKAAKIRADAMVGVARAEKNAQVRAAQLGGVVDTARAVGRAVKGAVDRDEDPPSPDDPNGGPGRGVPLPIGAVDRDEWAAEDRGTGCWLDTSERRAIRNGTDGTRAQHTASRRRAPARPLPLRQRVAHSGVVRPADLSEALGIGDTQARTYLKRCLGVARADELDTGRIEAPLSVVLTAFKTSRDLGMRAHAATLEAALSPAVKRGRSARPTETHGRGEAHLSSAHLRVLRPRSSETSGDGIALATVSE